MHCQNCGAALPSHGYICKNCGAIMNKTQIVEQKKWHNNSNITLRSDLYTNEPITRDYTKKSENKIVGALIIIGIVCVLIVVAILKLLG